MTESEKIDTKTEVGSCHELFGSLAGLSKQPLDVSFVLKHLHKGTGYVSQSQMPFPEHILGQNILDIIDTTRNNNNVRFTKERDIRYPYKNGRS